MSCFQENKWILLLYLIISLHTWVCPFTKVEESFNTQATHDILYESHLDKFDHFEFPGVVPRTFIGPLILSFFAFPIITLLKMLNISKFYALIIVRNILTIFVLSGIWKFVKNYKNEEKKIFLLVLCSLFHLNFYSSRMLPNTFALGVLLWAFGYYYQGDIKKCLQLICFANIVFRSELVLLVLICGFLMTAEKVLVSLSLMKRSILDMELIKVLVLTSLFSLGLTIIVDSFFWQYWLWPEGAVFWYNTYHNKSSNWGVLPYFWYFYSAIPRSMLLTTLPLIFTLLMACFYNLQWIRSFYNRFKNQNESTNTNKSTKSLSPIIALNPANNFYGDVTLNYLLPALSYVLLLSKLPHKELRFISYAIPILLAATTLTYSRFMNSTKRKPIGKLFKILFNLHICGNFLITSILLAISRHNYPGGYALLNLHKYADSSKNFTVYMDNYACQNGISKFLQLNDHWKYVKTENLNVHQIAQHNYLILEMHSKVAQELMPQNGENAENSTITTFKVAYREKGLKPNFYKNFAQNYQNIYRKFIATSFREWTHTLSDMFLIDRIVVLENN